MFERAHRARTRAVRFRAVHLDLRGLGNFERTREVIVRKRKAVRSKRPPIAPGGLAADRHAAAPIAEPPDGPSPDGTQQAGRGDAPRLAQTNIEQADERKPGPIETVLQPDPQRGIASFVESEGEESQDPPLPPFLDER